VAPPRPHKLGTPPDKPQGMDPKSWVPNPTRELSIRERRRCHDCTVHPPHNKPNVSSNVQNSVPVRDEQQTQDQVLLDPEQAPPMTAH
jgi:hypothetical protein